MEFPTRPIGAFIGLCCLLAFGPVLFGHYRENPDESTRPPSIEREPEFTEIAFGETGTIRVFAKGAGQLEYQWYKNGAALAGANQSSLTIEGASKNDAGFYHVSIASPYGSVESQIVRLRVASQAELSGTERFYTGDQRGVRSIVYYDGQLVGAGDYGVVWSSENGYDWTAREPIPDEETALDLIVGADKLIALLYDGKIAWTSDLQNWQIVTVNPDRDSLFKVVHLNGRYAAYSSSGTNRLFTSPDGENWSLQHEFFDGSGSAGLAANDNLIVATRSNDEKTEIGISADGAEWTFYESSQVPSAGPIAFGNELYLSGSRGAWSSDNGIDWVARERIFDVSGILKAGEMYYGIYSQEVYRSENLTDWESVLRFDGLGHPSETTTLAFANERFFIGPIAGTIYPVDDFADFRPLGETHETNHNRISSGVEYINGEFLMFSGGRGVLVSDTGKSWRWVPIDTSNAYTSGVDRLVYGNGVYANGNLVGASLGDLEGIDRAEPFSPVFLAFGNGVFIGTQQNSFARSVDGYNWELSEIYAELNDFRFGGDRFVGVGDNGAVVSSPDGLDWDSQTVRENGLTGRAVEFKKLACGDDRYVAIADSSAGTVFYMSPDAKTWSRLAIDFKSVLSNPAFAERVRDIEYEGGVYYVAFETILLSTSDFLEWEIVSDLPGDIYEIEPGGGSIIGVRQGIYQFGEPISIPPRIEFKNVNPVYSVLGETVEFACDAIDFDGEITKVEFYAEGELIGEALEEPYAFEITFSETGPFSISARAYDDSGLVSVDSRTAFVGRNVGLYTQTSSDFVDIAEVAAFRGALYALRSDGVIFRSNAPDDWEIVFTPTFWFPRELESVNGLLVAESDEGVYVCENGIDWKYLDLELDGLSSFGNWFIAEQPTGNRASVRSKDLYNWTLIPENENLDIDWDLIGWRGDSLVARGDSDGEFFTLGVWGEWERVSFTGQGRPMLFRRFGEVEYMWTISSFPANEIFLYRKADSGNWVEIETPSDLESVVDFQKVRDVFIISSGHRDGYIVDEAFANWTKTDRIESVVYENGKYTGLIGGKPSISENGIVWETTLDQVIYNGDFIGTRTGYIAWNVDIHNTGYVWTSLDGVHWEPRVTNEEKREFTDIAFDGDSYVAIGQHYIGRSVNGEDWIFVDKPEGLSTSIAYGNGIFIAARYDGSVALSTDGIDWESSPVSGYEGVVNDVQYLEGPGMFAIETGNATYWTSEDGNTWVERSFDDTELSEFHQAGDWLFARANNGVFRTNNGIDWHPVEGLRYSTTIFYRDGIYLAQTDDWREPIRRSVDGFVWKTVDAPFVRDFSFLRAYDFGFIAYLNESREYDYLSLDGINWSKVINYAPVEQSTVLEGERYFSRRPIQTSFADLGLRLRWDRLEGTLENGTVRIEAEIANMGLEPLEDATLGLQLRLTQGPEWLIDSQQFVADLELLGVNVSIGEYAIHELSVELPAWARDGNYGIQGFLKTRDSIFDTLLHNNYAWLRLSGLPAMWIGSAGDPELQSIELKWRSDAGYTNQIQYSTDLVNWFPLGPPLQVENNSIQTTNDVNVSSKKRYYRLSAE